jgi:hypothetical protein
VFFDEFDAPLAGTPLGWLSWFLAPMEDGEFLCKGTWVSLPRAISVFAGGTAHRAAEFGRRHAEHFGAAKGPDVASRLRGFLDLRGPNDDGVAERQSRRAVSIRYQLARVLQTKVTRPLLDALLDAGRYRYPVFAEDAVDGRGDRHLVEPLQIVRDLARSRVVLLPQIQDRRARESDQ